MTMREALTKAAEQFEMYASEHRGKVQIARAKDLLSAADNARAKARTNEVMAKMCRDALEEVVSLVWDDLALVYRTTSIPSFEHPPKSNMAWLVSETSYGKVTGWRHFQNLDEALKTVGTWVSQSAGDVTIARRDVSDKSPTNPLGIPAINYRGTHMIITDREGNAVTQVAQMTAHSTYTFGLPQALIDALSEYDIIPLGDWI